MHGASHIKIKMAFHRNNTICNVLNTQAHKTNIHTHSCIYQMKCHTCQNSYIGQTERRLNLCYKEHKRYITTNNTQSAYAYHILSNTYGYGPMETTMTLLHTAQKGKCMNMLENYYIQLFYHQGAKSQRNKSII